MSLVIESDVPVPTRVRACGPRISKDLAIIHQMQVGQSVAIPMVERKRKGATMLMPSIGVNIKGINKLLAPKVFRKKRVFKGQPKGNTGKVEEFDAIRIFREADAAKA